MCPSLNTSLKEIRMSTVKELIQEVVQALPDDASYDEILRELAFERMIERGLEDARQRRVIDDEAMLHRIKTWSS
jgi:predicted transcriptional regulator